MLAASRQSSLVVALVPGLDISVAVVHDLPRGPLGLEAHRDLAQILNNILATAHDGVFGCDGAVSSDAELEGREERVGNLVCGKADVLVRQQALRDEVAKRVVFFVEGEDGGVRHLYSKISMLKVGSTQKRLLTGYVLVSSRTSIFCWPSSRMKSSNLSGKFSSACVLWRTFKPSWVLESSLMSVALRSAHGIECAAPSTVAGLVSVMLQVAAIVIRGWPCTQVRAVRRVKHEVVRSYAH